jgi:tetratricopeptide (TPR) repeat protein
MAKKKRQKPNKKAPRRKEQKPASSFFLKHKVSVFRVTLFLIPLIFFVALELSLRFFNYGTDIPLFKSHETNPEYYTINPELGKRYFTLTDIQPAVIHTDLLLKRKPAQAFRIFVLGASSAAGYPYLYNGSFSSMLKVILKAYYPGKFIEIVNLAMPAVSSYAVRDIALELADYEPDLLLVYAGHNEFYGGLGVGSTVSLGHSRRLVNLYLTLNNYKIFQLLQNGISFIRRGLKNWSGDSEAPTGTLMERLARNQQIPYGSPLVRKAGEIFQGNLNDVIEFCAKNHIPLMIATLVSNIRDQPPFIDVFENPDFKNEWMDRYQSAAELFRQQNYRQALQTLDHCFGLDSLPASQYFLRGKIFEALGDTLRAYKAFYRAKDFDGLRFRAGEEINERISQIGRTGGATIVPVKRAFEAHSPGRLPGQSLLLEHLHPNVGGYTLMAKTFAETIVNAGYIGPPRVTNFSDSLWLHKLGVTDVDIAIANIRIEYLKLGWPFTAGSPPPKEEFRLSRTAGGNPDDEFIENLALQFWHDEITWEKMHVQAAEYYTRQKRWDKAEKEYRALIHATPMNASPYIFLGRLLANRQRIDEALEAFLEAIKFEQSAYAYNMIGSIYLLRREVSKGVIYLEKAAQLAPADMQVRFQLAQGYTMKGDFPNANLAIQQVLRSGVDFPEAKKLAAFIAQQMNNR